jgi:hypothetical protein
VSLVRPHLEYAVQVWSPYLNNDINVREKIQRREIKISHEMGELNYENRLKI